MIIMDVKYFKIDIGYWILQEEDEELNCSEEEEEDEDDVSFIDKNLSL